MGSLFRHWLKNQNPKILAPPTNITPQIHIRPIHPQLSPSLPPLHLLHSLIPQQIPTPLPLIHTLSPQPKLKSKFNNKTQHCNHLHMNHVHNSTSHGHVTISHSQSLYKLLYQLQNPTTPTSQPNTQSSLSKTLSKSILSPKIPNYLAKTGPQINQPYNYYPQTLVLKKTPNYLALPGVVSTPTKHLLSILGVPLNYAGSKSQYQGT